jgi:threonine/homoserine/homoserine lactone efflux protein
VDLVGLAAFTGALVVAVASPGPTVVALVARVVARGPRGLSGLIAGLVLGDVLWLAAAVLGAAKLATEAHWAFVILKWAGAAYLLWLAIGLWRARGDAAPAEVRRRSLAGGILGGLAMTLSNPKVMLFYLALVPNLFDLTAVDMLAFLEMAGIIVVVLSAVLLGYVAAAARVGRLFATPRAVRIINRIGGTVMAGAAAAIATRS